LSLNKSGEARVLKIDKRVRQVKAMLAEQDQKALGMVLTRSHA
jgi:hypothetical protein